MASPVFRTFPRFRELPLELKRMVWKEAAADLPILDIQRFTAEIILKQMGDRSHYPARLPPACRPHLGDRPRNPDRLLLAFTPHPDYIKLTTSHRGLLRACRESRKAAQAQIDYLLPIYFLTTDETGNLVARQGFVPFDSSGDFCISGLGHAIEEAREGRGARGSVLGESRSASNVLHRIMGLEVATTCLVKNLTIALDTRHGEYQDIRGWNNKTFDFFASRMTNLETVSFIGEGILNRRHHISQDDFKRIHKKYPVITWYQRDLGRWYIPWYSLWDYWRQQQKVFAIKAAGEVSAMGQLLSQNSPEWGSAAYEAISTLTERFEMNHSAAME